MSNMIDAIPKQMRDSLYEELNQWRQSGERDRWLKKLEEQEQTGKHSIGIALLSGREYEQVQAPKLLTTA